MVDISQTFITYHGCGNGYLDGTRKIVQKIENVLQQLIIRFVKSQSMFVTAETRAQIKLKPKASKNCKKIYAFLECFFKRIFQFR